MVWMDPGAHSEVIIPTEDYKTLQQIFMAPPVGWSKHFVRHAAPSRSENDENLDHFSMGLDGKILTGKPHI